MRGYSELANQKPCRDILWIKLRINNYRIKVAGTHISSRLVTPDDNNLIQTIKITLRVTLRKSEVLLNQKIFSKNSYMILYIVPVFWLLLWSTQNV